VGKGGGFFLAKRFFVERYFLRKRHPHPNPLPGRERERICRALPKRVREVLGITERGLIRGQRPPIA